MNTIEIVIIIEIEGKDYVQLLTTLVIKKTQKTLT